MKTAFYVEYEGEQVEQGDVVARIKKAWTEEGNRVKDIKTLNIYAKPEDNAAYYTINEDILGRIDLF